MAIHPIPPKSLLSFLLLLRLVTVSLDILGGDSSLRSWVFKWKMYGTSDGTRFFYLVASYAHFWIRPTREISWLNYLIDLIEGVPDQIEGNLSLWIILYLKRVISNLDVIIFNCLPIIFNYFCYMTFEMYSKNGLVFNLVMVRIYLQVVWHFN
jgi:hypothetical protein